MVEPARAQSPEEVPAKGGDVVYRHRVATRIWHWVNAVAIIVMLMSGLMIFNAHPRLYWGQYGANFDKAWLAIGADQNRGFLEIGGTQINTTGVLGRWKDGDGNVKLNAFPGWATIPSTYNLAMARRWHLAFAWILAFGLLFYLIASLLNRHVQRDLSLSRDEIRPSHLWHDIKEHARLRFPTGDAARRYNTLQKLTYIAVIFILIPLLIFTGITMSPGMNASWSWLLDLFGGRPSARSIHFIAAMLIVAFIVVHLVLVVLSNPVNELRSMITGRYKLPRERGS